MAISEDFPVKVLRKIVEQSFNDHINSCVSNSCPDLTIFSIARTTTHLRKICLEVVYPKAADIKVMLQGKPLIEYIQNPTAAGINVEDPYNYRLAYHDALPPLCDKKWPLWVELDATLDLHDLFYKDLYPETFPYHVSDNNAQAKAARRWVETGFCTDVEQVSTELQVEVLKAREVKTFQLAKAHEEKQNALDRQLRGQADHQLRKARAREEAARDRRRARAVKRAGGVYVQEEKTQQAIKDCDAVIEERYAELERDAKRQQENKDYELAVKEPEAEHERAVPEQQLKEQETEEQGKAMVRVDNWRVEMQDQLDMIMMVDHGEFPEDFEDCESEDDEEGGVRTDG